MFEGLTSKGSLRPGVGADVRRQSGEVVTRAVSQAVETAYETVVPITLTAMGAPSSWTVVTQPEWGTLAGVAPNLTYTPDADYAGTDRMTFEVDGGDTAEVVITIAQATLDDLKLWSFDVAEDTLWQDEAKTIPADTPGDPVMRVDSDRNLESIGTTPTLDVSGGINMAKVGGLKTIATYPVQVNNRTTWAIFRSDSSHTGYLLSNDAGSSGWTMRVDGEGIMEVYHEGSLGSSKPIKTGVLNSFIQGDVSLFIWHQTDTGGVGRTNTVEVMTIDGTDDAVGGDRAISIGCQPNGANALDGVEFAAGEAINLTPGKLARLEALLMERLSAFDSTNITITYPTANTIAPSSQGHLPIQGNSSVPIEAQWNSEGWRTVPRDGNGDFDFKYTTASEVWATLQVRAADLSETKTVPQVGVGRLTLLFGQSVAGRVTSVTGTPVYDQVTPAAVFDIQNYGGWAGPEDKHWATRFLARKSAETPGVPFGIVRRVYGSSTLAQNTPGTDNYAQMISDARAACGITGVITVSPFEDAVCEWGEENSRVGTPRATVNSGAQAIGGGLNSDLLIDKVRYTRLQNIDTTRSSAVNQDAYRDGIDDAIAAQTYILASGDLEAQPDYTSADKVHPKTVGELNATGDAIADGHGIAAFP
jgi:hypothetical protein